MTRYSPPDASGFSAASPAGESATGTRTSPLRKPSRPGAAARATAPTAPRSDDDVSPDRAAQTAISPRIVTDASSGGQACAPQSAARPQDSTASAGPQNVIAPRHAGDPPGAAPPQPADVATTSPPATTESAKDASTSSPGRRGT